MKNEPSPSIEAFFPFFFTIPTNYYPIMQEGNKINFFAVTNYRDIGRKFGLGKRTGEGMYRRQNWSRKINAGKEYDCL